MSNIEITANSTDGVVIWEPVFSEETLTSASAAIWPAGTLLGRITADSKLTAYTSGASDGSEVPKFVTANTATFEAAGDIASRVVMSGRVRRSQISAFGVGAITDAESDAIRDYGIIALTTTQLSKPDNG